MRRARKHRAGYRERVAGIILERRIVVTFDAPGIAGRRGQRSVRERGAAGELLEDDE